MKMYNLILPSFNSSDGISVDIFLSGCNRNPKCEGCHNPHLWDFNKGSEINLNKLVKWLKLKDNQYDNIVIMGGEPLDQPDLLDLLKSIYGIKPIWLFTSYELNEVSKEIKKYCNYIKTGKYIESLKDDNYYSYNIHLASNNQKFNKKGIDY